LALARFSTRGQTTCLTIELIQKNRLILIPQSWAQMAMIQSCWAAVQMFMMAVLAMTASMAAQASTPYQGVTLAMSSKAIW
jgi:hypothetical protein